MRSLAVFFSMGLCVHPAWTQWVVQHSNTTASLRGIDSIGGGIAWASGTQGTVVRTTDEGKSWQKCSVPPRAEKLDFRGVQAFDALTAVIMSSGPGDQSRIYKTTDGCLTWKLVLTNPDAPDGFFDAIQFTTGEEKRRVGYLVGDPVAGKFATYTTQDYGQTWAKSNASQLESAKTGEALFAASNSTFLELRGQPLFITGGSVSRSHKLQQHNPRPSESYIATDIPMGQGDSAGAFSIAAHNHVLVVVGGDYLKPETSIGTCALSTDEGTHWSASETPPNGYRSSIAYDTASKTWITVGPNGTDLSDDEGRHWRPLKPSPAEPAGADKNWNALSLPFAVGPNGRIGKLSADALTQR